MVQAVSLQWQVVPCFYVGHGVESLKTLLYLIHLLPKSDLYMQMSLCLTPDDFTLSNARWLCSSNEDPLGVEGVNWGHSKKSTFLCPLIAS